MSYSVFPEAFVLTISGFVFFLMASGSGKGKNKNGFRVFCSVMLLLYLAGLIWMAVFARIGFNKREIILAPMRSVKIVLNTYNSFDVFKLIVDNILVFVPFGMLFPAVLGKAPSKKSFWFTVFSGLIFSALIETVQYAFSLGYSEADDLVFNTLGCMAGAGIFAMSGKADYKNGSLTLKKGWLACLSPSFFISAALFAIWIYREYILYKK